jgi:hypothetical protein
MRYDILYYTASGRLLRGMCDNSVPWRDDLRAPQGCLARLTQVDDRRTVVWVDDRGRTVPPPEWTDEGKAWKAELARLDREDRARWCAEYMAMYGHAPGDVQAPPRA